MRLTNFSELRRAIAGLDVQPVSRMIGKLEKQLHEKGLALDPNNSAITQDAIYYIEPQNGVATKVVIYVDSALATLSWGERLRLKQTGFAGSENIGRLPPYHIMRCNTLGQAAREGWRDSYRMSKRTTGRFFFRILNEKPRKDGTHELSLEIEGQQLYICKNCLWKVTSILKEAQGATPDNFPLKLFFDVNFVRSWNSQGLLSKDFGFTAEMYPEDWEEICRIRKRQTEQHCEHCFRDFSAEELSDFLYIVPTDYVEGCEGYVKLDCICLGCLAEQEAYDYVKTSPEYREFKKLVRET